MQQIYKQCSKGQGFSDGPKSGHKCRLKDKRKSKKSHILYISLTMSNIVYGEIIYLKTQADVKRKNTVCFQQLVIIFLHELNFPNK